MRAVWILDLDPEFGFRQHMIHADDLDSGFGLSTCLVRSRSTLSGTQTRSAFLTRMFPAHCAGRPGFIDRRWFCAVNPFSGYSHRPSADPSSSLGEQAASLRSDGRFCLQLVQGSSSVFFNVFALQVTGHNCFGAVLSLA